MLEERLPPVLSGARIAPARRAAVGLLAVTVVIAAVLGVRLAIASVRSAPVEVKSASGGAGTAATGPSPSGASSPGSAPSSAVPSAASAASPASAGSSAGSSATAAGGVSELVIDVAGRVRHPRVVHLPAGSRVQDALAAAGGALPGSDLVGLNLAQPLADGEQVVVALPGRGSAVNGGAGGSAGGGVAASGTGSGAGSTGSGGSVSVDLNTADVSALDALPGVGPVLAQRILDWRTQHGRFSAVDELDEVSGIGAKLLAEIRPHVRL